MDQVISFSLSDIFVAAFEIYRQESNDLRADQIIELFKYNTNNKTHILLLRYGFQPELIREISAYVVSIDENRIVFSPGIMNTSDAIRNIIEWYLP
ncbi:hypothetical protein LXM25_18640 [Dyadobacter sp. LJ53]|nr:hypothetical protein [Dyadobacter chenwenxiniae]